MDRTVDKQKIQSAVRDILVAIGENPDREGLKDTPDRVARMFEEITSGYDESVTGHLSKTFEEGGSAIVVERDIDFHPLASTILCRFRQGAYCVRSKRQSGRSFQTCKSC